VVGGFLVRWLSENNIKVGRVVLVAPWLDPNKKIDPDFFNFEINPDIVSKTDGITVMYSTDDNVAILQSVEMIKSKAKNIQLKEFNEKGHFILKSLKTEEFPELISLLIG